MTGLLAGKTAFVAGASRGIGAAIAIRLAADGARVIVAARTTEPGRIPGTLTEVVARIRAAGGEATGVTCDVTDESSVAAAVEESVAVYGGLDVAVCNAGVLWLAPIWETPLKRWELALRVNLTGTFLVTRAVLPHIMTRASGSLIAITTSGVSDTMLGANAYWVAKAGLERLYVGLAEDLRQHNIAVNCLAPSGVVLTEGWQAGGDGREVPQHLIESSDSVAAAVALLARQDASGLTGGVFRSRELLEQSA